MLSVSVSDRYLFKILECRPKLFCNAEQDIIGDCMNFEFINGKHIHFQIQGSSLFSVI